MGKGMMAGKRKKPENKDRIMRKSDMDAMDRRIDRAKLEAETHATKYVQCMMYLALSRVYGFGPQRIGKVMAEMDNIYKDFVEKEAYGWKDVYEELATKGILVDGVVYDENKKVISYD